MSPQSIADKQRYDTALSHLDHAKLATAKKTLAGLGYTCHGCFGLYYFFTDRQERCLWYSVEHNRIEDKEGAVTI